MQSVTFQLSITADELLRLYSGNARDVVVRAENGQTVRFPAAVLRSHVDHDGVHGRFRIDFDADNRYTGIIRLA